MITPLNNKRFWFYDNWDSGLSKGSDEYGHHTIVIPFGKGRAIAIAYRAGYKKFKQCEYCVLGRKQTLEFEQEALYVQTYWNIEDYDEVFDLPDSHWDTALGINR